jgi:hypothetical protein
MSRAFCDTSHAANFPRYRRLLSACVAAMTLAVSTASVAQTPQAPAGTNAPGRERAANDRQTVDPQTLSCSALKAELGKRGELGILSGPRGAWSDTFYGPAAPRCEFWQIPEFTYVRARDGLCGVGYICIEKPTVY